MRLYNTRYFKWFYNRDYKSEEEQIRKMGLQIFDNQLFESHVIRGTKVNFFILHLILILVIYSIIRLL